MQHIVLKFNKKLTNVMLIIFTTFNQNIVNNGSIYRQSEHFHVL